MGSFRADITRVLAQFGPRSSPAFRRRALLPAWIRFFSWLFLLLSGAAPMAAVIGLGTGLPVRFALYGLRYDGSVLDPLGITLLAMILAAGTAAYGLLSGASWGISAGLLVGGVGLLTSVRTILLGSPTGVAPLDPLLLVPFLFSLMRLRRAWRTAR